jgi:hypothetical protein
MHIIITECYFPSNGGALFSLLGGFGDELPAGSALSFYLQFAGAGRHKTTIRASVLSESGGAAGDGSVNACRLAGASSQPVPGLDLLVFILLEGSH